MSDHKPWWQDNPELDAIRDRVVQELMGEQREPSEFDEPDPVVADWLSGASTRELAEARDELARAGTRYDSAVLAARSAGLSWGEIGQLLGVSRQQLHRRFSRRESADP